MTKTLTSNPLKWHGGKADLAKRIVALMPPRCKTPNAPEADDPGWLHYVEPYFGGGSVLLELDPEGISEVANDLNGELTNFWQVLQNADTWHDFQRIMQAVPFSIQEFWAAQKATVFGSDTDRAANFYVLCRQSLAGRMDGFAPLSRNRTRRGMNEQAAAWLSAVEGLPAVHERLKRVVILNSPALEVIKQQDGPRTLFYLDPPYLHETRATNGEYGEHEMSREDHVELLNVLVNSIKGRFLLSGYRSDLYDSACSMHGWNRHDFEISNHASGAKTKRRMVECVWCNY